MKEILNYLKESIDEKATIEKWNAKKYLSLQLAGNYDYYIVTVLGEQFLLMKQIEPQTLQKTQSHIMRIQEKTEYEVAVLLEDTTPYLLKKMLEERIAFIITDKQMYLPFLALHIKKQKKKIETERKEKFTAATQMVFLALLYSKEKQFGAEELAKQLDVSTMTVLRAFEELRKIGIVNCEIGGQTGRKKVFTPIEKKAYYHVGKDYLINPVKKKISVSCMPEMIEVYKSGLTALGEQTMLDEPHCKVYAAYGNMLQLEKYQVAKMEALEKGLPVIQIMQYDVSKLTTTGYVDPITLILSLGEKDDRIEIAIDELMEGIEWYEG